MRLGPYCGGLLCHLTELSLRGACLELATPAVFEDMASLRQLDMEGCTSSRTGSWLSRVLGSAADVVTLPAGLTELRAMGCSVFDKCALELRAATGLRVLELSSSVQLPATLKHAPLSVELGLHIVEEMQVGWAEDGSGMGVRRAGLLAAVLATVQLVPACTACTAACPPTPITTVIHRAHLAAPHLQAVTRQARDTVNVKACLADRVPDVRRLSGRGLGRSGLGVVGAMGGLRELCLLGGERRRLELPELELPELESMQVEGYQIITVRGC